MIPAKHFDPFLKLGLGAWCLATTLGWFAAANGFSADAHDPMAVVHAYIKAVYARDFKTAYELISDADRRVRDLDRYVRQRGPFSGFTLETARKLADSIQLQAYGRDGAGDRLRREIVYRVPDPQKVAPLVMHWDSQRLNSLSAVERNRLLGNLDAQQRDGSVPMSDGRETFDLRRENGQWRIYLDWAAGIKIPLRLELTNASGLEASLSKSEVSLQPGEVFDIKLRIKNSTPSAVIARIGHLVEPHGEADYLDIVQCGFLLPVTIQASSEQEYSGVYMLRGSLPERVRQLSLTYDFRILQ
jgi:hypothetical protein